MKLQITITTGNAAFQPEPALEVGRILVELSKTVIQGGIADCPLRDSNGNKVGELTVVEPDPAIPEISDGLKWLLRHAAAYYSNDPARTLYDADHVIMGLARGHMAEIVGADGRDRFGHSEWHVLRTEFKELVRQVGDDKPIAELL